MKAHFALMYQSRVDSGPDHLSSVFGFHVVIESGSFGFYHFSEERSGGTHAVILRSRPGNSIFFYHNHQNLIILLHLPAKEARR